MTAAQPPLSTPDGYAEWLAQLKGQIARARQRASLAVNAELVQLFGRIGRDILQRQQAQGWGAKVIDRLARDLKDAFPDMRGWSSSNLKYMPFFAQHCPVGRFGQQAADQLPWFHSVTLLTQLADADERAGYAEQAVAQGWSRSTLALQIKNRLVELKATAFKPEHAGQLNFYLAAVDAQVKAPDDKPTIGLLLCKQQNRLVAEYALSGIDKPIGVAEYQLLRDLPEDLGQNLPSIADIEAELSGELGWPDATEEPL